MQLAKARVSLKTRNSLKTKIGLVLRHVFSHLKKSLHLIPENNNKTVHYSFCCKELEP